MYRYIELFEGHDPEAYGFRAWIHENLGNHAEADRDHRMAEYPRCGGPGAKPYCVGHLQTRHANNRGDDADWPAHNRHYVGRSRPGWPSFPRNSSPQSAVWIAVPVLGFMPYRRVRPSGLV